MTEPRMGTPLQAVVGPDRMALQPQPLLDARDAAAQVIAAYLESAEWAVRDKGGGEPTKFRLNRCTFSWPDPDQRLDYPSASIDDGVDTYEAHNLVPSALEETWHQFGRNTVLWKDSELVIEFQVDFWANSEAHREAFAANLPRIFNPTEIRAGVILSGHPCYYFRSVRATLVSVERINTSDSVFANERRLRTVIRAEIDSVHLRAAPALNPQLDVQAEEP